MKPLNFIPSFLLHLSTRRTPIILCLGSLISFSAASSGATQYWDPLLSPAANGGTGTGGSGTWTAAGLNWSDGAVDTSLTVTNVADFYGSTVTPGGTITLTTAVTAAGLQFDTNNYIIGNGTTTGQINLSSQTASPSGILVASGVSGTSINLGSVKLGSQASGTNILLTNTDLVNFNNTAVYLSGSRTNKISNSSSSATTTYAKFALSDKPAPGYGTWPNTSTSLDVGNLTINSLAPAAKADGTLSNFSSAAPVNATFNGAGSGTFTINGDNTLFTNAGAGGSLSLTFNMANGTLLLGHDNALGGASSTTTLIMSSGTLAASATRTIANKLTINGTVGIGGSNAITLTKDVTNSGGNRTLTVNNTAGTTISGPVYLANDDLTARTLTIGGTGTLAINSTITNNISGNTLASNLTKSGTGALTLGGANTYTGNTTINSGSVLTLASTGSLRFVIQPFAVANKITGAGTASLNGTFNINVAAAGTPSVGDKWTLVDSSFSFGGSFSVAAPFAETAPGSGLWSYFDGTNNWYFSKLSGKLSYGVTPELVWDGDSGGTWSDGANWIGGAAPVSGDTIVFAGANTTNNNDISTDTFGTVALGGIIFNSTASSYSLSGNPLNLAGKSITNYSAANQIIAADIEADTGFNVNTSAGTVSLTGSLKTTSGFNKPLNKSGAGTLILNGTQNTSWSLNVNAGTVQVFNTGAPLFTTTIAPGTTLKAESGDIFHFALDLTDNGVFDVSAAGESFGSLLGTGIVTNHGASSAVTSTLSLGSGNSSFSGSIQNGPSGSPTAINLFDQNTGDFEYYTHTFSGNNTYSGDTTIAHQDVAFVLSSTGSLAFKPGDNGVSNKIGGVDQSAGVGSVILDGTFNIDLTGAAVANGNSWHIVSAVLLPKTTFGGTFNIPGFTQSSDIWTKVAGSNTWTFEEATGVLSLAVSGGSGFGSWVTGFGLAVGDQDPSDDPDHDGFSNQLEYVLGGNPNSSNTAGIAPTGAKSGGDFVLTFNRSDLSEADVITSVEYGSDLAGWTSVIVPAASGSAGGVAFSVSPNTPTAGLDKVVATIPNGAAARFFARVKAVK